MSGGVLDSVGEAFTARSIAPAPDRGEAAPGEAPIAWPDHPLAASDGEILATRILPPMGHNARDFACAAAVCRGWRALCRDSVPALSLYRETALRLMDDEMLDCLMWSPCGKFIAATVHGEDRPRAPRILIWRASTGALVNEWALATPATAVPQEIQESGYHASLAFSRDSTRVLTHPRGSNHFSIWSVPDGQLLAVNRGNPGGGGYQCADFGVPGSASDGLIGLCSDTGVIDLWDVSAPSDGEANQPRLRSRVELEPAGPGLPRAFSFSPDGSKVALSIFLLNSAADSGVAYVYDVASLMRLGVYTTPIWAEAAWMPDGRHVLVSWDKSACVWDFSRPEAPSVVAASPGPNARIDSWSPSGASYFVNRELVGNRPAAFVLEERRTADGSLVRAVNLEPGESPPPSPSREDVNMEPSEQHFPHVLMSPDSHALVLFPYDGPAPRVVVFE